MALALAGTYARRPVTRPEVKIGDWWMSGIATWGDLHTQTRLNGDWQAQWSIIRNPRQRLQRHPAFALGALVSGKLGPVPVFAGAMTEPDYDSGEFTALGAAREGEGALCLNASGQTTTKPNTAIDNAILRGAVSWTRGYDFGNTALIEADDSSSGDIRRSLNRLLDAWAAENDMRWYVDRHRVLRAEPLPDESAPVWFVTPGTGELGTASDEVVGRVFVRFTDSTAGDVLHTASWPATTPTGTLERGADITNRGSITPTRAQNIAKGVWRKLGQGRAGWTNGIEVTRNQITTKGGIPAHLGLVKAGDVMRLLDVPDPRGLDHHLDVVIGDTDLDWAAGTLQLNPDGMAARSFEDVLETVSPGAVPL